MSPNIKLENLRLQIRALEGHKLEAGALRVLPFADPRLNAPLPGGGLMLGALHEFCATGLEGELTPAVTAFAATVAGRILRGHGGFLLWAASQRDCYAPGLARLGLDPSRIVWTDCAKDAEVLGVMEEALYSRALAAVLGEAEALSAKAARRLDAAARQSGTTALLLRRYRSKPVQADGLGCGAAATRWRVSAVPSETAGEGADGARAPGLGPPRFRLDLEYCRNGRTASWIVEVSDGAKFDDAKTGHVRVAAQLRDDACPPEEAPAREPPRTARSY